MADRIDLENKISDRLSQLGSLLTGCYGIGAQWIEEIGPHHRDNILWLASDMCNEARGLVEQLPGATMAAGPERVAGSATDVEGARGASAAWVPQAREDVQRIGDLLLSALEGGRHSGSAVVACIEAAANVLHFMQKAPDTDLLWSNDGDPAHVLDLLQSAYGALLQAQVSVQTVAIVPADDDLAVAALLRALDLLRDLIQALQSLAGARHMSDSDAEVWMACAQPRESSPVAVLGAGVRCGPALDDLRTDVAHARSLANMLASIVSQSGINDGEHLNAHIGQTQQAFALLDGLERNLGRIAQWMEDAEEAGGTKGQGGAA